MHFQAELDALFLERIENRRETLGEIRVTGVDHVLRDRRERVQQVPDRAAGKAVDDLDAELLGGLGGVDHVLRGPLPDTLGLAVAPDLGRNDALVTPVDVVADALADQVVRDGEHLQAVLVEHRPLGLAVVVVLEGLVHLEVVAPAGQFQAVITPTLGFLRQDLQRQVRPLSGEKRYWSCHLVPPYPKDSSHTPAKRLFAKKNAYYPRFIARTPAGRGEGVPPSYHEARPRWPRHEQSAMALVPGVTTGRGTQSSIAHQGRIIIQGAGRQAMSNSRQFSDRVWLASGGGLTPSS